MGKTNPHFLGNNVHEIASSIVGCDIFEHPLVKGRRKVLFDIKGAQTIGEIVKILDNRHKFEYGEYRLWNYYPERIKERKQKIKDAIPQKAIDTFFEKLEKAPQDKEYQLYLQRQTPEQFRLAKKHGWEIAKMLTEPEPNFHIEDQ